MRGEGKRPLAALVVAVLAAAFLAACGGSESSSSSSTSGGSPAGGSTTTGSVARSNRPGDETESSKKRGGGGQSQSDQGGGNGGAGKSVEEVETPLKVSGGGSTQFRTKGGDNSVQDFGEESDGTELQEAAEVVHGFYVSRAAEQWDKACSYLAKSNIEQLEQLANQAQQSKGADCASVLEAFTQPLPAAIEREITTVDAGSLRHEGEQGFLIYYGAGKVKYAMPLRAEGGSWKVAALSGVTLD